MDAASHVEVRVTQRFGAPAERVFDAWLDPEVAGRWLFATAWRPPARVKIDARVGGSFCFVERRDGMEIEHAGAYVEIVRPRH
ncbi:MAG: SRPBCC domain-containing protein, partial [Burkholderiales bacterium]|nr:SRPBCC domain-containing protein [Burkholderiales bacterium]